MNEKDNPQAAGEEQTAQQQEELAAYEKLRRRVRQIWGETKEVISADAIKESVERAAEELKEIGDHSRETIAKAAATLKKDLASTADVIKPRLEELGRGTEHAFDLLRERGGAFWDEFGDDAGQAFAVWRDKSGALLAAVAKGVGDWSQKLGGKLDEVLVYRTGEATHGGAFACVHCGCKMELKKPGHLPPCPKCHKTEFRRA